MCEWILYHLNRFESPGVKQPLAVTCDDSLLQYCWREPSRCHRVQMECFQAPISFGVWHSSSTSMSSAPWWQSWKSIFNYIQKKGFTCCSSARCWFTFIQLWTKNLAVKRHNRFLYAANEQLAIRLSSGSSEHILLIPIFPSLFQTFSCIYYN